MIHTREGALFAAGLASLLALGCSVKDEDRCPDGYEFVEITLSCHPVEEAETADGAPDGGGEPEPSTGDETSEPPTGLGESCAEGESVCADAGYEADYCVVNPLEPEKAYCSTRDCLEGRPCEEGYSCCDCSDSAVLPKVSACLTVPDAELAGSPMGGCDCGV